MTYTKLQTILDNVTYPSARIRCEPLGIHGFYIQAVMTMPDADDPDGPLTEQRGRKWYVSTYAVESEVVQTALYAVLKFVEHEAREQFKYKGVRLFGPHIDVNALMEIASRTEVRT